MICVMSSPVKISTSFMGKLKKSCMFIEIILKSMDLLRFMSSFKCCKNFPRKQIIVRVIFWKFSASSTFCLQHFVPPVLPASSFLLPALPASSTSCLQLPASSTSSLQHFQPPALHVSSTSCLLHFLPPALPPRPATCNDKKRQFLLM